MVAWRSLAQLVENYVKKGAMLYIEGKLQTRNWEKDGQTHRFDLCEKCYDELIKSFLIPIDIEERNEIV